MIAAAAFALLLAQAPAQAAPATPATVPEMPGATAPSPAPAGRTAPTPVSPVIVTPAPAEADTERVAAELAQVYDQSCGGRIYGTYAQVCNTLAAQLAKAQGEARKDAARKAKLVKSTPAAVAAH